MSILGSRYDASILRTRLKCFFFERGGLLGLVVLMLYAWLACPHILNGDNAEFASLSVLGGAAHPTGYPLYVLWLRFWSWLPVESPAYAAALATALIGAVQALVLHAACRAWGARPAAASLAVALLAASPIILRVYTQAEVFAMNGLIAALVLWLAATNGPVRGTLRVALLGLVAGLGISNHVTCVLLTPVGLVGVIHGVRESQRSWFSMISIAVAALVLGLMPYVYLLLAPDTWMSWGKVDSVDALVRHFLRSDYGGPGAFARRGFDVPWYENQLAFVITLGRAYWWVFAALGLATLGYFTMRRDRVESRVAWAALAAAFLLAGPLLALRFNLEPAGLSLYVVQRFHILPLLVLVIPVALGLDRLGERAMQHSTRVGKPSPVAMQALAVVVLVGATAPSLDRLARLQSPAVELALRNMLTTLPPNAIVIGTADEFYFGMGYLQGALGMRPDVGIIATPPIGMSFYRDRIARRTGVALQPVGAAEKLSVKIAEQMLATGRPVFIDTYQANIAVRFRSYPYGLLHRLVPEDQPMPSVEELFALNKALFEKFKFGYPTPRTHDDLPAQIHGVYARTWYIIAEALATTPRRAEHEYAVKMALTLAPDS